MDHLDATARRELERHLSSHRYARDEFILAQDAGGLDVFFVLDGTAKVTIYSVEGKVVSFRDMAAGDIFGEFAAIDAQPRSASIVATSEVVVGRLAKTKFEELVETLPPFAWALLRHLTAQARYLTGRVFEFSTLVVAERVTSELVRLGEAAGQGNVDIRLASAPTHAEIAARISTHREAVSRAIRKLSDVGLVDKSDSRNLILKDLDKLRAHLQSKE